ncbi:uncharacterized protein MYCFIDRAFT_207872 [Pseudocercospora fijiensis CIRAD86]|uniref:Alpha/beta hydrolase fold-3 domain-containing protein n=1 Tax=Pseudocercospora fijiensis (strain CIRAD86) TaxID=383855 RepID=M3B2X0_PSEFD|nr:uncharacterized protein MYCFIDRAFT_207872 [Pseudocercospora fijiensis CIRAD86]EME83727.1 hypothetical protein MYCFIDRAFT_207872 [Pseudocercospora fijiensis CIRAD86]
MRQDLAEMETKLIPALGPISEKIEEFYPSIQLPHGHEAKLKIWRSTKLSSEAPLIVFFHGGGYFSGSLETRIVISAAYRLSPEHEFPKIACRSGIRRQSQCRIRCWGGFLQAGGTVASVTAQQLNSNLKHKITGHFIAIPWLFTEEIVLEKYQQLWKSGEKKDGEVASQRQAKETLKRLEHVLKLNVHDPRTEEQVDGWYGVVAGDWQTKFGTLFAQALFRGGLRDRALAICLSRESAEGIHKGNNFLWDHHSLLLNLGRGTMVVRTRRQLDGDEEWSCWRQSWMATTTSTPELTKSRKLEGSIFEEIRKCAKDLETPPSIAIPLAGRSQASRILLLVPSTSFHIKSIEPNVEPFQSHLMHTHLDSKISLDHKSNRICHYKHRTHTRDRSEPTKRSKNMMQIHSLARKGKGKGGYLSHNSYHP